MTVFTIIILLGVIFRQKRSSQSGVAETLGGACQGCLDPVCKSYDAHKHAENLDTALPKFVASTYGVYCMLHCRPPPDPTRYTIARSLLCGIVWFSLCVSGAHGRK